MNSFFVNLALRSAGRAPRLAEPPFRPTFLPGAGHSVASTRRLDIPPGRFVRYPSAFEYSSVGSERSVSSKPGEGRARPAGRAYGGGAASPHLLAPPKHPAILSELIRAESPDGPYSLPEGVTAERVELASSSSDSEKPHSDGSSPPSIDTPRKPSGEGTVGPPWSTAGTHEQSSEPFSGEEAEQGPRPEMVEAYPRASLETTSRKSSKATAEDPAPSERLRSSPAPREPRSERGTHRPHEVPVDSAPQKRPADLPPPEVSATESEQSSPDSRRLLSPLPHETSEAETDPLPRAIPALGSFATPSPASSEQRAQPRAPSVEVHIGTIEVRRSELDASRESFTQPDRKTEPKGFDAYAAQRRYEK